MMTISYRSYCVLFMLTLLTSLVLPTHLVAADADALATDAAEVESPGQADLDAAIDAKLAANELDDFATVLDLCKRATKKGLSEDAAQFADNLYTGTLIDRAGMVVEALFAAESPDPRWPQMRSFALRDLHEALERDAKLGEAQLMLARLESLPGGNRDRARKAADAAIELVGDDNLQSAQAHIVRGNLENDKAKQTADYDKAVELAPRDKDVRRTRGLFHLLNDDFQKARDDLAVAIEDDPEDASLQEALGMTYMMDDNLEKAQEVFDKAIEIDPEASGPLLQRARVLAMRGQRPQALADLDKAIQLNPDDAIPLVLRARIQQQAGNTVQAENDIETVLEKIPDHPAAIELRGLIAADRDDYPAAIRDFRRLVAKNSDDPLLIGQLGLLYLAAKQPREAIKRFTRSLEIDDKQFLSRRGKSDAEISIGDHKAALADLEKALELKPEDAGVLNNLAWLLATSPDDGIRDGKRAIELATKACEKTNWEEAHIVSTLAAGYAEAGEFEKACQYSAKAVETGDSVAEVKKQLESELASYQLNKPWREKQDMPEAGSAAKPLEGPDDPPVEDPFGEDPDETTDGPEPAQLIDESDDSPLGDPPEQPRAKKTPRRPFE